jgi:Mg-chelatase subunit ChlD
MLDNKLTRSLIAGSLLTIPLLLSPSTAIAQDGARINADGTVDFTVYLAFAPTGNDIAELESYLRESSQVMCDATDGQLRYGKVRITTAASAEGVADVWILPDGLWTLSGSAGLILDDDSRVFLATNGQNTLGLTHEMGHALLDLPDAYDNQNYKSGYFGIGYARDPGVCSNFVAPIICVEDSDCGAGTCVGSTITPGANTIMSHNLASPRCSAAPFDECPLGDIECPGSSCEPPPLQSELLTSSYYDFGDSPDLGPGCPGTAQPGEKFQLNGHLNDATAASVLDLSDLDSAKSTAGHHVMARYFDQIGAIDGLNKHSNHDLWAFAELEVDAINDHDNVWRIHFVIESAQLANPPVGELTSLGSVRIDFNGGSGNEPFSGDAGDFARVLDECDANGVCAPPSIGSLAKITLPALSNGALANDLEVEVNLWQIHSSSRLGYSRVLAANDDNQRGHCDNSQLIGGWEAAYCDAKCTKMWSSSPSFRWVAAQFTRATIRQESGAFASEWDRLDALPAYVNGLTNLTADSFNAVITAPNPVSADSSAACGNADDSVQIDSSGVSAADTIVLLIDDSRSMDIDYDSFGQTKKRLQWAQGAAGALADLIELNNDKGGVTQQLGLVHFSSDAEPVVEPQPLLSAGFTADQFEDSVDELAPGGATALSQGLEQAGLLANGTTNPAILVLTDGEPNRCLDGSYDGDGGCDAKQEAIDMACELNDDGIQLFYTPLNNDLGGTLFAELAQCGPSANHASDTGRELPLQFGRSYLNFAGIAPIIDGRDWTVSGAPLSTVFTVEQGASNLRVLLTSRADDPATWDVGVDFTSPSGGYFGPGSPTVEVIIDDNQIYKIVNIANPEAGAWIMRLWSNNANDQDGYTLAWTDTPEPDVHIGVSNPLVTDVNASVNLSILPSWRVPVEGATCELEVERPDGSVVAVSIAEGDSDDPAHRGKFNAYGGRGVYEVHGRCTTSGSSRFAMGDAAAAPNQMIETPAQVPVFEREATTTFFVDTPVTVLPPGSDCDGDGYPDTLEAPPLDSDGDGLMNACDPDSDNDDIPDSEESLGDSDGDGISDIHDVDADNDGEHDSSDYDSSDPLSYLLVATGDFDGDGELDQLHGEPEHNGARGRIVVDYGSAAASQYWGRASFGIQGLPAIGNRFGAAVAVADFDGDGFDDVAIGAPGADHSGLSETGELHIIYGSSTGLTHVGDQLINTDSAGIKGIAESDEYFGSRLSVGDFDCNGYADLVIGVPDEAVGSVSEAGIVHVLYGSSGGVSAVNDLWYQGDSGVNGSVGFGDRFGDALASGDFDADTCDDLVVGVPGEDWNAATSDSGESYAIYGSINGLSTTGDWTIVQGVIEGTVGVNERFGTRLWAAELNGDNYDDLRVMTPGDPCPAGEKGFNTVYGGAMGLGSIQGTWTCEVSHD